MLAAIFLYNHQFNDLESIAKELCALGMRLSASRELENVGDGGGSGLHGGDALYAH